MLTVKSMNALFTSGDPITGRSYKRALASQVGSRCAAVESVRFARSQARGMTIEGISLDYALRTCRAGKTNLRLLKDLRQAVAIAVASKSTVDKGLCSINAPDWYRESWHEDFKMLIEALECAIDWFSRLRIIDNDAIHS